MKSYYHYSNKISKKELYNGLVGCGLFAEKIPNFLCSKEFLKYSKTITIPVDNKPKDYIRYSSMRNINVPRQMAIPEPFVYASLCNSLKLNWDKIQKNFKKNTQKDKFKVSRIHLRKLKGKCSLFEMNYKNYEDDGFPEQDLIIKSKYVVIADISKCFPSIYSHAIAWALVGKSFAKTNRNPENWFNELDFRTRNVKYGETNGVLIGPHTSNLISEIILTKVDKELRKKGFEYIRHIDDYTCYTKSYEEAEKFFLDLSTELSKYELSLNLKKSEISPLPKASVKNWVNRLNHYVFVNTYEYFGKKGLKVRELQGFIDFSIDLMLKEQSDASVLNYAIKIIANKHLGIGAKEYYLKQIHHLVLLFPYLVSILEEYVFKPHKVEKSIVKSIANDIYAYGIERNIYEACSYALYWASKYGFKLDAKKVKKNALRSNDCIYMLSAFIYHRKTKPKAYLAEYRDKAESLKITDFDRYWVYIYEVLPWSDLPLSYKEMKKEKISFLKSKYK
ncbi:MAG: RNA-directed DNA polymerase [Flavobacteriales bacterium]